MYPNEPAEPKSVTDAYIANLRSWGNRVLGIATTDRLAWRTERRCLRKLQQAGQIR